MTGIVKRHIARDLFIAWPLYDVTSVQFSEWRPARLSCEESLDVLDIDSKIQQK